MSFEVFDFAFELPKQGRRLAQRALQAADGIFQQCAVKAAGATPVLRQKPAPARGFEQRGLNGAALGVQIFGTGRLETLHRCPNLSTDFYKAYVIRTPPWQERLCMTG